MLTEVITTRRATSADAATLTAFGRRVFSATFQADNTPEDLAAYLDAAYTLDRQLSEIADTAVDTLLCEADGDLAGFAQLRFGTAPDEVAGDTPIELWRLYLDPRWHGRGVAARLMVSVEEAARARGATTLWLGVWERNLRAQKFYEKQGFVPVGSHTFVLGSDPQRDVIMAKMLAT